MFKKLFSIGALSLLSSYTINANALPSLPCGDSNFTDVELNWVSSSGCHYSDSVTIPYTESGNDVGVKLFLPSGVDATDTAAISQALDKVIVYLDGWNGSHLHIPAYLQTYYNQDIPVLSVVPGVAGADGTGDYADKIKKVLEDLEQIRSASATDAVIFGYSLGGVAGRLALAELENIEGKDHGTGLFISYDAPQTGLATPQAIIQLLPLIETYLVDLQNFINGQHSAIRPYLQEAYNEIEAWKVALYNNPLVGSYLNSGIFKDLLNDNVLDTTGQREALIQRLDSAAYPSTRNIAVSNGTLAIPTPFEADQSGGTYARVYGRTDAGNTYGFFDWKMYPTVAGQKAVEMNVGATGYYTNTFTCFWFFTCTQSIGVTGSFPRAKYAASDVLETDQVPGSYVSDAPYTFSYYTSELLGAVFPHSPIQTNSEVLSADLDLIIKAISGTITPAEALGFVPNHANADQLFRYTFVSTASAFGLPADSDVSLVTNAYADPVGLTSFDVLISIPEEQSTPTNTVENLVHTIVVPHTSWTSEIDAALGLTP